MGNNSGERLTFYELIEKYRIKVPIMQRDYAQGRDEYRINRIRRNFIENIYLALEKNRSLDLDFIYGSKTGEYVILIDGQQRITTLFLLHWYLTTKDDLYTDEIRNILSRFTYETRISSREFCEKLVSFSISRIKRDDILSDLIKDQPWFFPYWERDPTIKSMLTMLDAIHRKFYGTYRFLDRLKQGRKITFQFLLLEEFGLTDELYIKMNARGKLLTDFENFKAKFEQFIEEIDKKSSDEFQNKIEKDWQDFFWRYRDEEFLTDEPLMRFIYYITEMLYYLNPDKIKKEVKTIELDEDDFPIIEFEKIKEMYSKKENLKFLFDAFNKLVEISDMETFFENLFSKNKYEYGKVALFSDNINLFKRCIRGEDFGIFEKLILFTILTYLIKYNKNKPDRRLKDLIRVLRNLLKAVRYFYRLKIIYRSDLRYEDLSRYLNAIKKHFINMDDVYADIKIHRKNLGFPKDAIANEIEKAEIINITKDLKESIFKLEDHPLLQGMIFNLKPSENVRELKKMTEIIYDIWGPERIGDLDNSLIIRSMLTIDDYGIWIGWSSGLGNRFFFGHNERWNVVLTYDGYDKDEDSPPNIVDKFLSKLVKMEGSIKYRLKRLISEWLKENSTKKDYYYYFIKYSEMTKSEKSLYAWNNAFEIRDMTGFILNGSHINPYVKTVCMRIDNEKMCDIENNYIWGIRESPLRLKNKVEMYCKSDGWEIVFPKNFKKKKSLIKDFRLEVLEKNNHYLMRTLKDKEEEADRYDRIKKALKFINALYS